MQARADFAPEWLGADVDHAADAVAPKPRWHRPPIYIDALNAADGQTAEVHAPANRRVERHPVEKNLNLFGRGPANGKGAKTAQPAVAADVDAGRSVEDLRQVCAGGLRVGDGFDERGEVLAGGVAAGADHQLVHEHGQGLQVQLDPSGGRADLDGGLQRPVAQPFHAQIPSAG